MHMADALLSPVVGGVMWAASAGTLVYCSKKITSAMDELKTPLMGVLGAFIFAAQMINFTIPGTGSSGHLGGGMILAILLGPNAAFLVMASILTVQALFFADGGLLALGCNMFNLGVFPCFIAYPLIYKTILGDSGDYKRITAASILSVITALQLGSLGVVMETSLSGITELPLSSFAFVMQPIHLAIGLIEGIVTAVVIQFIIKVEPDILNNYNLTAPSRHRSRKPLFISLLVVTLFTGGFLSWYASSNPDGLEWSITKVTGQEELHVVKNNRVHSFLSQIQEKIAFLPEYGFKNSGAEETAENRRTGTAISGILGGIITIALVFLAGFFLKKRTHTETS